MAKHSGQILIEEFKMKTADRKLEPYIEFIRKLMQEVDVDVDLSRLKTVTDCKNVINVLLKKINDKMVKTQMNREYIKLECMLKSEMSNAR